MHFWQRFDHKLLTTQSKHKEGEGEKEEDEEAKINQEAYSNAGLPLMSK